LADDSFGSGKEPSLPNRFRRELGLIAGWLLFPLFPVVLEDMYCSSGSEPHDWDWFTWVIMLGPLLGYGFLAGATLSIPDDPAAPRRRLRRVLARRAVWVAIGPWSGFLFWVGVYFGIIYLYKMIPDRMKPNFHLPELSTGSSVSSASGWVMIILFYGIWAYGWLWPAWFALARAGRVGQWKRCFVRGIVMACTFVGSLFGSFWAATAIWRSYYFDSRLVPLLLIAVSLAVMSGCAGTITYGEMRRRELFHAMLVAWVLGLALMWRWWSRARPGHP
jgi:hypothetical protein